MTVNVTIGTSSSVSMTPNEARRAIRSHLDRGVPFSSITLDDERWIFDIQMQNGISAKIIFPENEERTIQVELS